MDRLDAYRDRFIESSRNTIEYLQSFALYRALSIIWKHYILPIWTWTFCKVTGIPTPGSSDSYGTKETLVSNDVYRDRLLAKEIELFIDLANALGMTGAQRHAFFEKFLHIDWLRRSAVTVQDLFLFCGLRRTRFADCILPLQQNGFRQFNNRFEIVQLITALFNICTLSPPKLVEWVLAQAKTDVVVQSLMHDTDMTPPLKLQLAQIMLFVRGTLSPNELYLKFALEQLYMTVDSSLDFATLHGITDISCLEKFPILIYPVFWIQRTLRRRVLGPRFWRHLEVKRLSWRSGQVFYNPQDLIAEANANNSFEERPKFENDSSSSPRLLAKVLPVSQVQNESQSNELENSFAFAYQIQAYSNEEIAWEVSADNLLVGIHVKQLQLDGSLHDSVTDAYATTVESLRQGTVSNEEACCIRKSIVKQYGYQFADFIIGFSHLRSFQQETSDARSKKQRGKKSKLPIYWEKLFDPKEKRAFYYNALTGESEWDLPPP